MNNNQNNQSGSLVDRFNAATQRTNQLIGTNFSTFQRGTPYTGSPVTTTLNASDLSTPTTPITVPQINPSTPAIAPAVANPTGTTTDANGTAIVTPSADSNGAQSTSDWIKEQFKSLGNTLGTKSKVTQDLQKSQQLEQKTQQATTDYNAFVQAKTNQAQTLEKMYEDRNTGVSAAGANASISDYERKGNANLANLAIVAQASQGLQTAAQQTIKDKLDAQFQPIQDQIDFLTKFAAVNNNDLTESEKFKLQQQADQKKTDLADVSKTADDLHQALLQNNAPQTVYSALDKITNDYVSGKITAQQAQSQMYQASGQYGVDAKAQVDLQNARLQGQKLLQDVQAGQLVSGEYAGVINGAVGLVAAAKRDSTKLGIANALASQDYQTAYANIANAVEDSLTGSNKTKFADMRTDIGVMSGMKDAIQQYVDAGGNLGYLKGSADKIAKNFGQLATDPKFAALGVQLQREFQAYRLGMTGAAFSPQESKEYEAVNPRTNATLDLNLATIDGALNQLTNRVTSTINARIPDAQKIHNLINGQSNTQTPVMSNGVDLNSFFSGTQASNPAPSISAVSSQTTQNTQRRNPLAGLGAGYQPINLSSFFH